MKNLLRDSIVGGATNSLAVNSVILPLALGGAALGISVGRYSGENIVVIVCCAFTAVINGVLIARAIKFRKAPEKAPSAAALLARWNIDLDRLWARFKDEYEAAGQSPIFGGVRVLPSWLFKRGTFGFTLIPIEDVAWVHKKVTTRRVNFVPVAKTYSLVLHTIHPPHDAVAFEFAAASQVVDQFLATLAARVPWAILGWNAGFAAQWRSNRKQICAQILARQAAARAPVEKPAPAGTITAER